jgi:hypothetical protein
MNNNIFRTGGSKVKRFDKEGRDVTELPGLWDESDSIEYEMNNWIHISDKLPPINEFVLFCCHIDKHGFGDVELGWYEGHKTEGDAIAMETSSNGWYPCTHWMPLPELPEVP